MQPSTTLLAWLWELPIDVIPIHDIDHATVAGSVEHPPVACTYAQMGREATRCRSTGDY
jgi:hypothetical protein